MRLLTLLLIALEFLAQEPAPPAAGQPVITVPAGTKVALRLASPLGTKTAQTGDAVHAEAAFPVTVSNTVAIPPGTYLEGVIDQVTRRGRHAGFTMHFTHMVFSNGYTASLSATADTRAGLLRTGDPVAATPADSNVPTGGMALQSAPQPTLSQPHRPGPDIGVVVGLTAASAAVGIAIIAILAHRGADRYLPAGWRFELALSNPLSLDARKVAAAVANPVPR
jgi:hypothetical protein